MNWIETPESSNISRFKYDEERRILTVEFQTGATYDYFDIPPTIASELSAAPSKGQFLARSIKGVYRYARL
jgi:hypothetical protein